MSGARFSATEALRIGLVQAVGDRPIAEQMLEERIAEFLQAPPGAIAQVKAAVARLEAQPITPALLAELQRQFDAAKDAPEPREGRTAAREKRSPHWAIER